MLPSALLHLSFCLTKHAFRGQSSKTVAWPLIFPITINNGSGPLRLVIGVI